MNDGNDLLKLMGHPNYEDIEVRFAAHEIQKTRELLFHWQRKPGTNFASQLFGMFMKADPQNMLKLKTGFPVEHYVWHEWYMSQDPDQLFKEWGFEC